MKNRLTNIITIVIVAALCGLILLQVYFLKNTYQQEKQTFNNNVISLLNDLSKSLEEEEAVSGIADFIYDVRTFPPQDSSGKVRTMLFNHKRDTAKIRIKREGNKHWEKITSEAVVINKDTLKNSNVFIVGTGDPDSSLPIPFGYRFKSDSNHFSFSYRFDDIIDTLKRLDSSRKKVIVSNVINKMILADQVSIENRISQKKLDSLLNNRFNKIGIDIPYRYSVYSGLRDSLYFIYGNDSLYKYKDIETKAEIFSSDILPFRNLLVVDFPSKGIFIYKQIIPQITLSVLFILLITLGFLYTIRTIHKQKKIAGNVVNFINNMTHEFKTPISTIAIASDAISKPEVLEDRSKVCRYNNVISEENTRMRQQVEKILEMAIIEERNYDLKIERINIHELLKNAAQSLQVRLESNNGIMHFNLKAQRYLVMGDKLHISNIFNNILDNSVKYCEKIPELSIITENSNGHIHIIFEDNGIGIKAQDAKKVFEKYYRVPTGNLHNVKGFGLGLSYVKHMVEAHKGSISLVSESGKGTKVEIIFPAAND